MPPSPVAESPNCELSKQQFSTFIKVNVAKPLVDNDEFLFGQQFLMAYNQWAQTQMCDPLQRSIQRIRPQAIVGTKSPSNTSLTAPA